MADVSFFDPKQEAEVKRRRQFAAQLAQQGQQTPSEMVSGIVVRKSPLEGLAKALTTGLGGYESGQADRLQASDQEQKQQLLAKALSQYGSDPKAAAQMLLSSPGTSDVGMKLYTDSVDNDRALALKQADYAREDAKWDKDAALKRELAQMRSGSSAPTIDPDTGEIIPGVSNKPLPVGALKIQQEALDALAGAKNIEDTAGGLSKQLDSGALKVGPVENMISWARNQAGASSPNSQAYSGMESALEKIRNDSLRLNKGVQTEGDAQRAMNEVLSSKNDHVVLKNALDKLAAINQRGAELQKLQVNGLRQNYNAAPYDFEQINALPSGAGPALAAPQGKAESVLQHLVSKGMTPEAAKAYIQSKGIK